MLEELPVRVNEDGKRIQNDRCPLETHNESRSVTLVGEADRKMLKAAIKHSSGEDQVRHRIVPTDILQNWVEKLTGFTEEVADILKEEKEEKHACHIFSQYTILATNHRYL